MYVLTQLCIFMKRISFGGEKGFEGFFLADFSRICAVKNAAAFGPL